MNEVFMIFLSLSLSGSLIALPLYLLRPLFKDRLSKTWQYYILLIVIFRLLIPYGPKTSLAGMLFNQAGRYVTAENVPASAAPGIHYALHTPPMAMPQTLESGADHPRGAAQAAIDLLWLGWFVPALILMSRKIIGYRRSVRAIKAGCARIDDAHVLDVYREVCRSMKIKRPPALAQNASAAAPILAGTVRPAVILTDTRLGDKELRYVLQHELTHYKRLDIVYKWLAQIAVCLHWYNPLVYRICREINRSCELSCDEAVIMRLDETEKYGYGDMLLETIKPRKRAPPPVVSLTLNEDAKQIKERLDAIMNYQRKSKSIVFISLMAAVFLLCGAAFAGAYSAAAPDSSELARSSAAKPTVIDADGEYIVAVNSQSGGAIAPPAANRANEQTVVYESVEMRRYEQAGDFPAHPYIHEIKTNHTDKKIVAQQRGMLAYDKDGKPLRIDWFSFDSDRAGTFYFLYDWGKEEILPGKTYDVFGGWSLNLHGKDSAVNDIAYVLYCDKEITFEDGTVWENPDFDKWCDTYEGKTIDVAVLESYYPYVQKVSDKLRPA